MIFSAKTRSHKVLLCPLWDLSCCLHCAVRVGPLLVQSDTKPQICSYMDVRRSLCGTRPSEDWIQVCRRAGLWTRRSGVIWASFNTPIWVWFNLLLVKHSPVCWERLLTWVQFLCLRVCLCVCAGSFPLDLYLILTDEFLVRDVCRKICVQQGTESQAIAPTAAEVGHIDVLQTDEREGDKEWRKKKSHGLQTKQIHEYWTMIMSWVLIILET